MKRYFLRYDDTTSLEDMLIAVLTVYSTVTIRQDSVCYAETASVEGRLSTINWSIAMKMTDEMFKTARKMFNTKGWASWLAAASVVSGEKPDAITKAVEARIASAEADEAIASLMGEASGLKMNKTISQMAEKAHANGLILSIGWDEEKKVATANISKMRAARSTDGKVSSNSRISAFVAYQRGKKAGDTFTIAKAGKAYKDGDRAIPKRQNGGLAGYILKVYPSSKTAAILTQYGYTL
jgi:hypothetical protein